ncbi:MAG TPA: hypothetical protein VJP76_02015 [Candidatus Tumulicola sp.]|nr:hypothetical protein [Candidatus Tumulicola sp.]
MNGALSPEARDRYVRQWRDVQARFADEPRAALLQADVLIARVMDDCGYPVAESVLPHAAPGLAGLTDSEGERQALVHYRSVFEELVGSAEPGF